jgi:flavin-dependent dehydrogenase
MKSSDNQVEVGIIGGGPAGSAAAITLARSGRSVLLIEKTDSQAFKVGESLPPAITPLLRELGVLERFESDRHLISDGNESSWGGASLESSAFRDNLAGPGWHVDRPRFDAMLRDAARDAGAAVTESTRVARCERETYHWRLALEGSNTIDASALWLIDCTGRRSWLARREGVKRRAYDNLTAFVALFHENKPEQAADSDSLTLIESVEEGWWYTARVPNGRRVVVYLTDIGTPSANTARTEQGYRALLEETTHIQARLRGYSRTVSGAPMITSSNSSRLERMFGAGWLAAGDAATSFDPLSSQGVLTAAYSGLKAGRALDSHLSGDLEALRAYELRINTVYDAYLNNRGAAYSFEQRWQESEFWRKRRQSQSAPPSVS